MRNIPTKSTGDSLSAAEFNDIPGEEENLITDTSQSLTDADLHQMSKAMSIYAAAGDFYTDSGSGNTYTLTRVAPLQAPIQYIDGMSVRFRISHTNTGAAQVNVNSLGLKNILRSDRVSPINPGDLPINQHANLIFHSDVNAFTMADTYNPVVVPIQTYGLLISMSPTVPLRNYVTSPGGGVSQNKKNILLNSSIEKSTDLKWSPGNMGGCFPQSVTKTNDTWYHTFLITKPDGTADSGVDDNISATHLMVDAGAVGYTEYLRTGSIYLNSTQNINPYIMHEDGTVRWLYPLPAHEDKIPSAARLLIEMDVPKGIINKVTFILDGAMNGTGIVYASNPAAPDVQGHPQLITTTSPSSLGTSLFDEFSNTNSEIGFRRVSIGALVGTDANYGVWTIGWKERRV